MKDYQGYNKALRPLAHDLRHSATKAEACLWKYAVRAGQMKGYTFRRQRPVLNFIADFMCQPLMLIIELDGGIHQDEAASANDLVRQTLLENAGFTVLRYSNSAVLHCLSEVKLEIEMWIDNFERLYGLPDKAGRMRRSR